jgi:hypothetical protein
MRAPCVILAVVTRCACVGNGIRERELGYVYGLGQPSDEAACTDAAERAGRAVCRRPPDWCPLPAAADAPPQMHGTVPCALREWCRLDLLDLRSLASNQATARLHQCLGSRRLVILGDSTTLEVWRTNSCCCSPMATSSSCAASSRKHTGRQHREGCAYSRRAPCASSVGPMSATGPCAMLRSTYRSPTCG